MYYLKYKKIYTNNISNLFLILVYFWLFLFSFGGNFVFSDILSSDVLQEDDTIFNDSVVYYVNNRKKYNILINCSTHGNEDLPSKIIEDFINKGYFSSKFSFANYVIILKPSKYRLNNRVRYSLEGIDPNRTFISLFSQSSKLVLSLFSKYDFDLLLDLHEAGYRENTDFMYSNGFYSKFFSNFINNYKVIYDPNKMADLLKLEEIIISNQEKIFKELYKSNNIVVSKYYVNGNIGGYEYISILRNYSIVRKIPSILFETVNKENKKNTTLNVYYYFLNNLKNNISVFREYKDKMKDFEDNIRFYYLFDKNYDNIEILKKYLEYNGINFYKYYFISDLDKYKLIEYSIKDAKVSVDREGMKGLIYVNFEVYTNEVTNKTIIQEKLNNSLVIPFSLLVFYLLDPTSKENLFNLNVLPINLFKARTFPTKVLGDF